MSPVLPLLLVGILFCSSLVTMALSRSRPADAVLVARSTVFAALAASIGMALGSTNSDATSLVVGDRLGTTVAVFVSAMAAVIGSFASRSLAADPRAPRFFAATNALVGSTIALALANRPWLMAASWVAVSASTVLLIGSDGRAGSRAASLRAARAFMIGDIAVIVACGAATISTAGAADSLRSVAVSVGADRPVVVATVGLALLVGAFARSAQVPLHGWLPASVAAPTPVSAMLHAGVVNGSAILLIRWHPLLSASAVATLLAAGVGLASVLVGMAVARTRPDVKSGLAWTTVAQMGFMTLQCSLGLVGPAVVHLMAHGMFKSSLFLGAGSGLDRGGSHHHPRRIRPGAADVALAGIAGAGIVGVGLLIVRPHFLDHPAAILPVGFAWATVAYALAQWWARMPHRTVSSIATPILVLSAAFTATTAISAVVDRWLGSTDSNAAPPAAGLLAVLAVATVAVFWCVGAIAPRTRPALAASTWMRVASWATPQAGSIRFALDHRTEDLP